MAENQRCRELTPEDLGLAVDPASFGFTTTAELEPSDEIIAQPRALRALDLGMAIRHAGYNIYVAGMSGTEKIEDLRRALEHRVRHHATPRDWLYVNNFDEPDVPLAIALAAGQGGQFKRDMTGLVEELLEELPKAFRQEDFDREKKRLSQQYQQESREVFQELEKLAKERNLTIQQLPDGQILFVPLKGDRAMSPEEAGELPEEEIEEIGKRQQEMIEAAQSLQARQQEISRRLTADVREVERAFAARLIEPRIQAISQRYDNPKLAQWLQRVKADMIGHLGRFRERPSGQQEALMQFIGGAPSERRDALIAYEVNLLVDNSKVEGAPVVVEEAPNYKNLFGTIDRIADRFGRVTTNFTRIKAGSLLRASGGYLVFNLMDALTEPLVWKELKRAIKSGSLSIETYDPFALITTSAMKPEPIPLDTKVVVLGEPLIYHLLYLYDEDFQEIFKVKADFSPEMDHTADSARGYGCFLRRLSDREGTLPFSAEGVAEMLRAGARLVDDKTKLTAEFSRVGDLAREASYWATQEGAESVADRHVQRAWGERVYRSDLIAAKIRELIEDGTLLIDLDEPVVGQINGLAVADLGDYAFGRPTRVTASTGIGAAGIINIERESKLSGRTYDKGMLILEGYLRNQYAAGHPLALSASLAMEQSYGMIDGDSASSAELYCLLSALAGVPLRQDIAVTGSVNQWGQVQAIGGVNEKIEGFYDVCKVRGLTERQGVCIPTANVKNVVLRRDVVEAVRQGKFHVWAVATIDQGIELLTGQPAGRVDQAGTFHSRVLERLGEMASALKEQRAVAAERESPSAEVPSEKPPDPRPPYPGRS